MKSLNFIFILAISLFSCATQSSTQPYYLQKFEPEVLGFIGVSSKEGNMHGAVIDPDGYVHVIVVGQRIGALYFVKQLIKSDDGDKVILTKIIQDPNTGNVRTEDIEILEMEPGRVKRKSSNKK